MTDIPIGLGGTTSCPACGAQVELPEGTSGPVPCPKCGEPASGPAPDAVRGDVTLDEALRAFGVNGYDTEVAAVDGSTVRCNGCGGTAAAGDLRVDDARSVVDDTSGDTAVVAFAVVWPAL